LATPNINTSIWLALRAKVAALTFSPAIPVLWPGEAIDLPADRALEVTHFVNRPDRPFLGSTDPHDRVGILQIAVLSPLTSASQAETVVREIAGDIADFFVVDEPLRYGVVTVKVSEAPEVGGSIRDDARSRLLTPVSIRWQCFA
jgi:hypothetical protein